MLTASDIERKIIEQVRHILAESSKSDAALDRNLPLADGLGLDSLEMASLFIALEDEFKVDPFSGKFRIVDMRSIADLTHAYAQHAAQPTSSLIA